MGKKSIPIRDSLISFSGSKSSGIFDYFSDSTLRINELFNHLLIQTNKNKLDVFQESIALMKLATFASSSQSLFSEDSKRKAAKAKRVKQILYTCKKSYGLITVHTFSFPVINYKGDFFYDKNGPDGGFNLYEKVKQKKDQEEKTEKEYIPLEPITYEQISSVLEKKIRSTKIASEMRNKRTCAVGYYFFMDKRTLKKRKIPQLKCVVILGHKRMTPKKEKFS